MPMLRDRCICLYGSQKVTGMEGGKGGQTVSRDNPEHSRNNEVTKRAYHRHEELGLVIDVAPRLQCADKRFTIWDCSDVVLVLGVLGVDFLGIGCASIFGSRRNG
jgi:hypothetical protein